MRSEAAWSHVVSGVSASSHSLDGLHEHGLGGAVVSNEVSWAEAGHDWLLDVDWDLPQTEQVAEREQEHCDLEDDLTDDPHDEVSQTVALLCHV